MVDKRPLSTMEVVLENISVGPEAGCLHLRTRGGEKIMTWMHPDDTERARLLIGKSLALVVWSLEEEELKEPEGS